MPVHLVAALEKTDDKRYAEYSVRQKYRWSPIPREWHHSSAYQAAIPHRLGASDMAFTKQLKGH
ncbi:hypothetical protein SAMN05428974_3254 [Sphingopyxis sp. YR583]|uniref:hypothetical protein n=1 Tax=Sphingopyxis sp. YR583 TaxID=1881047 RepID=UPI0008A7DA1A|nr:hypothetical protein [Sphingopyxis sp. YR583]SEH19165.1 hypothetical protein SAMN05428974_3254 [Sphingopyxis sp. YR583]